MRQPDGPIEHHLAPKFKVIAKLAEDASCDRKPDYLVLLTHKDEP